MTPEVITPAALPVDESTPGVARATVFQAADAVMVYSRIAPGTTSGWHHHGDRTAYGYIVAGDGAVEFTPDERHEAAAGDCFVIPAGLPHRDVNPTDHDVEVLVCFVGTGPVVVNVDGPPLE